MHVAELWRYPVKSMSGEELQAVELKRDGMVGDRIVHVEDRGEHVITSRTHPRLLGFRATLGDDGEPLIDGRPWLHPEFGAVLVATAGEGARLVRDDSAERFDVLPLLIATDGAIAALGVDRRRLRPNIVIGGVPGLAERQWPGRRLRIGEALVNAVTLRRRCVMTTFDPDTQVQDLSVLRRIAKEFGGTMALDCDVVEAGRVAVGDRVELL
jgi:MOSC domain-containing protein